jgi:hypothetical protein
MMQERFNSLLHHLQAQPAIKNQERPHAPDGGANCSALAR